MERQNRTTTGLKRALTKQEILLGVKIEDIQNNMATTNQVKTARGTDPVAATNSPDPKSNKKDDKKEDKKRREEEEKKKKEEEKKKKEDEKKKKEDEIKKKKEEKDARKRDKKIGKKRNKQDSDYSERSSEDTMDSSVVDDDDFDEEQEWSDLLNFNPNFEEDNDQEWGEQAKAESFEEFNTFTEEPEQYAVPVSALIYDPFQSRETMEEVEIQGPISEMPETILVLIMSHLNFDEILRMSRLNKMFNRYTKNKTLWQLVYDAYDHRHFGGADVNIWQELGDHLREQVLAIKNQQPPALIPSLNSSPDLHASPKQAGTPTPQSLKTLPSQQSHGLAAGAKKSLSPTNGPSDHAKPGVPKSVSQRVLPTPATAKEALPATLIHSNSDSNLPPAKKDDNGKVSLLPNTGATPSIQQTSLNKLVAAVTPFENLPDIMDQQTFITTYQTFTTNAMVVRKLIQRFQVPALDDVIKSEDENKFYQRQIVRPIKLRVTKLLKLIIDTAVSEFTDETIMSLKIFIYGIADSDFAKILAKSLDKGREAARHTASMDSGSDGASISGDNAPNKKGMSTDQLYDVSSDEIARQLTLLEFETYSSIKPAEFFGQAWAKPKTYHRAPHIRAMIDRFNMITRWISTLIVTEEKIRNRAKRFVKFIKVAECLRQMHNYHTLMAVLSGLNDGPVYRLKFTKDEIPPKYQQSFQELQDLMKADFSYKSYREELAQAQAPCIPYIGIYLRDLTYFEEGGNNAQIDPSLINFKKNKNVYSVIQIIQRGQMTPYPFKKNEKVYNYLKVLNGLDTEGLSRVSMLREPRNAKRSDIA
eukprot:TRINITY_DN383_c0_g2_i1.p1 TRINITY_DN383_c0_g2~~TRINITY_DN383_c0_g2_i1.p1  ORF type:complete len:815 (+),score=196.28 TRINITY_DN383_c0_g2_i1:83-2527(+)